MVQKGENLPPSLSKKIVVFLTALYYTLSIAKCECILQKYMNQTYTGFQNYTHFKVQITLSVNTAEVFVCFQKYTC